MAFVFTTRDVSRILGISQTQILRLKDEGKLKAIKTARGVYLFDDESVYKYAMNVREKLPYVVIYIRVNSEEDVDEIERQKKICEYFCELDDAFKILRKKIFIDYGGKSVISRKNFLEFASFIKRHKVKNVIVSEMKVLFDMPDNYLTELLTIVNIFVNFEVIDASERIKRIKSSIEDYMKVCEKHKCDEIVK